MTRPGIQPTRPGEVRSRPPAAVLGTAVVITLVAWALVACGQGQEDPSGPTSWRGPCPTVPVDQQRAEGIETLHAFGEGDGSVAHGTVRGSLEEVRGTLAVGPDGSRAYGTSRTGGSADAGLIFSFDADSGYGVVHEFGPGPSNGERPTEGPLVVAEGRLWGLTAAGGVASEGVAFSVAPDGSDFRVHHAFEGGSDGSRPIGPLVPEGTWLYGLTSEGGRFGLGTVFRVSTQGEGYELLASFGGSDTGAHPYGRLTVDSAAGSLYGFTAAGGENDPSCDLGLGTLFRLAFPGGSQDSSG